MDVKELIDSAAKGRSRAKLAEAIGIKRQTLHALENGTTCPPWVTARLAEEAGVDAISVTFQHLKQTARSEEERGLWERMLVKTARALTLAAALVLASSLYPKPAVAGVQPLEPRYTLCRACKQRRSQGKRCFRASRYRALRAPSKPRQGALLGRRALSARAGVTDAAAGWIALFVSVASCGPQRPPLTAQD